MKNVLTSGLVVLCMETVLAQNTEHETSDTLRQLEQEETRNVLDNLERKQVPVKYYEPLKIEAEKSVTIKMEIKRPESAVRTCQADLSIDYLQFDTKARVDAIIENNDCRTSGGQYKIQFQVTDENGQPRLIEQVEAWTLDDTPLSESRKFYDIGSNVELIRTITRELTCVCVSVEPGQNVAP